jgi:hypothetical protein
VRKIREGGRVIGECGWFTIYMTNGTHLFLYRTMLVPPLQVRNPDPPDLERGEGPPLVIDGTPFQPSEFLATLSLLRPILNALKGLE